MSEENKGRLPGLDGLRAIAVLMVIFYHQELFGFGWTGVQIFFVLSGFLITRILFRARGVPLKQYVLEFYGRRSLRIFPLYFGVLLAFGVAVALGLRAQGLREGLPYAATYTYNFWHAPNVFKHSNLISHFWSLCVEEQFYLIWPFFIYFCPERMLHRALLIIVAVGPLVRLALYHILQMPGFPAFDDLEIALYLLTPSHVDAFALGAYFSLSAFRGSRRALFASFAVLVAAGLALNSRVPADTHFRWSFGFPLGLDPGAGYIWGYSLLNLCAALLLDCVIHRRFLPKLFESRALSYVGKISYGVYILHYPIQSFVRRFLPRSPSLVHLGVQLSATIAIASLSFYLWEMPFLRKKDVWFKSAASTRVASPGIPAAPPATVDPGGEDVRL